MPIHHAVLALLADRPSYGYELKASFTSSVGPQWGDLNFGHLYQVLDRLVRDKLVTKRVVPQSARPAKSVYRLTAAGREELERWLDTPFVRRGGYRDDFFLKLLAASRLGPEALDRVVRIQREAYLAELATLAQLHAGHDEDPLVGVLLEAAELHTEANLKVLDAVEAVRDRLGTREEPAAVEAEPPAEVA
jgi:DNA-binding PadR family transcriptional regulator